jgi:hypothetical protein
MTIVLSDRMEMAKLLDDSEPFDYLDRYLEAGLSQRALTKEPHITFKIGEKVVAKAAISVGNDNAISSGYSLNGGDQYDQVGAPSLPVDVVITVKGDNVAPGTDSPADSLSIITTIMREFL